jgi:hypothetical protein
MYEESTVYLFHQNICGLKGKTEELFYVPKFPSYIVFFRTPPQKFELVQINVDGYRLGTAYCKQVVKRDAVSIFVKKILKHTNTVEAAYYNRG